MPEFWPTAWREPANLLNAPCWSSTKNVFQLPRKRCHGAAISVHTCFRTTCSRALREKFSMLICTPSEAFWSIPRLWRSYPQADAEKEFLSVDQRSSNAGFCTGHAALGHSDQGDRSDGVQLMVHRGYAYVGHMFSKGFTVIDVRDARSPRAVAYVPAPSDTWNIHLQTHDDLLLVIHAKDMFAAAEFQDERAYYSGAVGEKLGSASRGAPVRTWSAGMAVYDIAQGDKPRSDRFYADRGRRDPSDLVHRRKVGLCVRAYRRIFGLYFSDDRHDRPDPTARSGPLLAAGNECCSGREPILVAVTSIRAPSCDRTRRQGIRRLARRRHGRA